MQKTIEQLQVELDRKKEYTTKLNRQIKMIVFYRLPKKGYNKREEREW